MRRCNGLLSRRVDLLAVLVLSTLGAAAASMAQSTTMGFTRQFHFPPGAGEDLHWISVPWNYQPQDVGIPTVLDAEDLCQDLGGEESIAAVVRWDEPTSMIIEHPCGGGSPFSLEQGTAYALRNVQGETILGALAGAHDDGFTYSIAPTSGSQLSWLSIPYHIRIPEKLGDLRVTAEDLCRQIGSSTIFAVVRWDEASASYQSYGCGSMLESPFEIERGEGYGIINRPNQVVTWQPVHY